MPEKRQYRCRIVELDPAWHPPTRSTRFECGPPDAGTYTFEAQAIDRYLRYSRPAPLVLTVLAPRHRNARYVVPLALGVLAVTAAGVGVDVAKVVAQIIERPPFAAVDGEVSGSRM